MTASQHDERSVFLKAIDIASVDQRTAFLDAACGDNQQLRAGVDALLRAHGNPQPLLDVGDAPMPTIHEPVAERPGMLVGPYKLLEQIGEGGFGVVFMAEQQQPVRRKVAFKVLKPGMDTRQVVARFEAERQALAIMDHPNIAKVFDGGATPSGRPYFVMELVKGIPITEFCDNNHLTPRERLALFIPICQAVQHAHQKGIIHRDLKPSNVMVMVHDTTPVPKVIDFGVAKALGQELTEKTLFTGFAQMIGTPLYMSPEQAGQSGLDIDTRSDIYSLGVLLYELLTSTTPFNKERFKQAAYDEIRRIIREEDPPKPSTRLSESKESLPSISAQRQMEPTKLTKLVRGELDWIVMKALEKDRNRRYGTASDFARDVQRYLADEPVQACPPSAGYRLRKFARRSKAALVMVSVVVLTVLLVVGSFGWMVRDRTARDEKIARDRATRQTVIKERVTLAIEEALKRHQEGRWREALDAAKRAEALAATGESDEETQQRAREVLGDMQMLANLENVRVRSTQNEAGFDLKEEDSGNARAFREYGIDVDTLDRDEAAMRLRLRSIRYELAVFLDSWSHVRRRLGDSKAIGKDWRELLEIARAVDPDPWRDRFRKAVLNGDRRALVELAASAPILALPAETVDRLGDALLGEPTEKEAAAFLKKGQQVHPQDYWINLNLAGSLMRLGQRDDAIHYYMAAVALRPEAASSQCHLGHALAAQGNLDDAIACFRKCIELNPNWGSPHKNLAAALERQGKPDEAALAYQESVRLNLEGAVAACRESVRRKPDDYKAQFDLGDALGSHGKLAEAVKAYQEAFRLKPVLVGKEIVNKLVWHIRDCADPKGRDPKAAAELVRQVMAQNPNIGQDPNAALSSSLALILLLADDTDTYRRLCVDMIGKHGDTKDPQTAYRVARICGLAPDVGPDAAVLVQIADRAVRAEPAPHYLHAMGLAQYRAGQFDKALEQLHKSIKGAWNANAANWLVLAMVHQRVGRFDEARKSYDEAVRWIDGSLEGPSDSLDALRLLHPHDALACLVLRREAETLLGLRPEPEGKQGTAENK